jgi:hypothetical protein
MTSLVRIRPYLRLAAFVAALCALLAPATAGASVHAHAAAKKKAKPPVVTSVRPMNVEIGQTLEIRGKYFIRGRYKNTVAFKRDGGKAVFAKAKIGTAKLLRVTVPAKLKNEFKKSGFFYVPTRFHVRVLSKKFGKRFTPASKSPLVALKPGTSPVAVAPPASSAPSGPSGPSAPTAAASDCDKDGTVNSADTDDDNDLLPDSLENAINATLVAKYGLTTSPLMGTCDSDSDDDGVEDGYEYQSARDLNDDEFQNPNEYLPYPGKRPYANPLFADADVDYDGDSLTLTEEYHLWKYVGNRTLTPLSYSDGEQYSASHRLANGHREPTLEAAGYPKQADFVSWATASGYRNVTVWDGQGYWYQPAHQSVKGLFDVNRDGTESPSELAYNDINRNGYLSDDERDEDADGLTNYDESHGRMLLTYWNGCYAVEKPFHNAYAGTDLDDPDSDGDGVRDGADDQDHDDIPNMDELSRVAASNPHVDDREKGKDCELSKGNFTVTGGPLPNGALTVTFVNQLGQQDVPQLIANGSGLTGGSVSVATRRQGDSNTDEQQTVTISGAPTAGGFTLSFAGSDPTPQIAYTADAAAVEAALKALVPIDGSNRGGVFGRVNPFNPCLPYRSRTCPTSTDGSTGAGLDDDPSIWLALQ